MSPTRWRLDGRPALVTGGTKGIGLAICTERLALGATIVAVARTVTELDPALASSGSSYAQPICNTWVRSKPAIAKLSSYFGG